MIAPMDHDPVKVPATLGNRPCCRSGHGRISPPGRGAQTDGHQGILATALQGPGDRPNPQDNVPAQRRGSHDAARGGADRRLDVIGSSGFR
jgi:hypothetical protein